MKKTTTIVLVLAATHALAQEPAASQPAPFTNGPVVLKGIYGTRSTAAQGERPRSTHNVTTDALRRFVEIQNADGSWGADGTQQLGTAFCLISFLRNGETHHSETFGKAISHAHSWLIDSRPKSDPERVATAIALSDYITVHYRWHYHPGADKKAEVPSAHIQKIRDCINDISPQCGEMWKDLLSVSRLPEEIERRMDGATLRSIWDKYLDREPNGSPSTLDEYLLLHLCSSARFHHGGKKWSDWNREFAPMMVRTQEADGLFPCKPEGDRITATGISVMSLTVYYIFAPNFSARSEPKAAETQGQEIKIDVK